MTLGNSQAGEDRLCFDEISVCAQSQGALNQKNIKMSVPYPSRIVPGGPEWMS